ncbi:MAG TPA: hypothetical protein VG265_01155 [Gaiellaceae bacterium]|nr:hypothetical protein [Gaiellaceae bacterium]
MDGDDRPVLGGSAHPFLQGRVVDGPEVLDPGLAHQRLEADDSALVQFPDRAERTGDQPAPEREVDERVLAGVRELEIERLAVDRRRHRVEGHVGEPLPLCSPGLVAVDVDIDPAGNDVQPSCVEFCRSGSRERPGWRQRGDYAVADPDVGVHSRGERAAADDQVVVHPRSSTSGMASSRTSSSWRRRRGAACGGAAPGSRSEEALKLLGSWVAAAESAHATPREDS